MGCVVYALLLSSVSSMIDGSARGQTTSLPSVEKALDQVVQPPAGNDLQMEQFLLARIPPLPKPSSAKQWSDDEKRLRQRILRDVVYHGWPQEWVDSAPHFELMGTIETDKGYQIRKLRYQIVPGFLGTALLYEPENIHERMPAVLNLPATNLPASRWSMNRSASPVRITATESTEPLGTWKLKQTRNSTPGQTNHPPGWEKVRCSVKRFRFWLLSLVQLAGHHFRIKGA